MRLDDITNRIVLASATIIAIAALGTAVYQATQSRDQAKTSVWPYLIQGNSGNNGYASIVQNLGVGPAVIKSFGGDCWSVATRQDEPLKVEVCRDTPARRFTE
jgi:hypothetical protein